jgi:hypothetical protein
MVEMFRTTVMSSRTGRKRSANSQGVETSNAHKTKKTRIVEPDEDPAYFEQQVESSLEQSARRGRVKTDGYDSDSTDDGEGVVSSRKKGGVDKAEDLDDMFAAPDEIEVKDEGEKKEKYMRLGDIEGQEFGNDDMQSGSESKSEGEPEDEDDAEQRKKAGMGYELSSFNMREEMEEGKFTEDGSYIRTFDPNVVHDRWMDGISDKEIKLARRRKRELEKKLKEQILAEEKELEESGGKASIERDLLPLLKRGETVLEALQRLGSRSKKSLYVTPTIHEPHHLPIFVVESTNLLTMSRQLPILRLPLCPLAALISITKHMKSSSVVFGRPASSTIAGSHPLPTSNTSTSGALQNLVSPMKSSVPSQRKNSSPGILPHILVHLARRSKYVEQGIKNGAIGTMSSNDCVFILDSRPCCIGLIYNLFCHVAFVVEAICNI